MKLLKALLLCFAVSVLSFSCSDKPVVICMQDFGLKPGSDENAVLYVAKAIEKINRDYQGKSVTLQFAKGTYHFYPTDSCKREYFISNHDQQNPKFVGIALESLQNLTLDGGNSDFIFHGRMLPLSVLNSEQITLCNFSVDFENPHIAQVKILSNDTVAGMIVYEVAPWVNYDIREGKFIAKGDGWEHQPLWGIAFEGETKRLIYQTSDIAVGTTDVEEIEPRKIRAPWKNTRLIPGSVVAMRGYGRPTPGIFLSHNRNTSLKNINVHYAEGMGLLAQMSENIFLDKFSVCLRGKSDPRYFTTQADATHFSACKGVIDSRNGLYEAMMDDAINVHGTYLKIVKRVNDNTVLARYMHPQAYGFEWGMAGDQVQFVNASTMELIDTMNKIATIQPAGQKEIAGAKEFEITFETPLDPMIQDTATFGIENLEWTPEVVFDNNIIRNNRARGTLFSTPKKTVVQNNLFDHTSGSAILLAGDCNGWFETGACKDILIANNRFINSLTMLFQFTNAIISIYPEIPNLPAQKKFFHRGIVIKDNYFETFDAPLLYAKSVDSLVFEGNTIVHNASYPKFHWNHYPFFFEHVSNVLIQDNKFDTGFNPATDIKVLLSAEDAVTCKNNSNK